MCPPLMVYNSLNGQIAECTVMAYVAYYRVSTQKQGQSGLGLEAQRASVAEFIASKGATLMAEYSEVESGSKDNRPELQKALRACRLKGATLLIAKLDRLSRSHRFLVELQDSKVDFVCVDMPDANRLTIHLLAALADYERQLISERTTAALKAAKAMGVQLGNPRLASCRNTDTTAARAVRTARADAYSAEIREVLTELEADAGHPLNASEAARMLNDAGYQTSRGSQWTHVQVGRVRAAA